jgi:predicted transposase YbfD/YdcC
LGRHIRGHWGIEHELHWVLAVAFREDANRTRARNAGAHLGRVRRLRSVTTNLSYRHEMTHHPLTDR